MSKASICSWRVETRTRRLTARSNVDRCTTNDANWTLSRCIRALSAACRARYGRDRLYTLATFRICMARPAPTNCCQLNTATVMCTRRYRHMMIYGKKVNDMTNCCNWAGWNVRLDTMRSLVSVDGRPNIGVNFLTMKRTLLSYCSRLILYK